MVIMKLLIVSVGSLVGQNILDVLDYEEFNRRKYVTVYGTNSLAQSANNFRCDKCYIVPNTASEDFKPAIIDVIKEVEPDLILCGRDEDTEVLWKIMEENPGLPGKLPYGNLNTLIFALDKWQTWLFSQKYNLPFAETFLLGNAKETAELKEFCQKLEYPLIAKPVRGFASKGVFFVRNWEEAVKALEYKDYILQEYLGEPENVNRYFESFEKGLIPLFSHAPDTTHHSCYTFINPDGDISPIFITRNVHNSGRTVEYCRVQNKELEILTMNYAKALRSEGGAGPISVQFRRNREGGWKVQEINMRTNGNTYTRLLIGQDELALIINAFLPEFEFPEYQTPEEYKDAMYFKTMIALPVTRKQLEILTTQNEWSAAKG